MNKSYYKKMILMPEHHYKMIAGNLNQHIKAELEQLNKSRKPIEKPEVNQLLESFEEPSVIGSNDDTSVGNITVMNDPNITFSQAVKSTPINVESRDVGSSNLDTIQENPEYSTETTDNPTNTSRSLEVSDATTKSSETTDSTSSTSNVSSETQDASTSSNTTATFSNITGDSNITKSPDKSLGAIPKKRLTRPTPSDNYLGLKKQSEQYKASLKKFTPITASQLSSALANVTNLSKTKVSSQQLPKTPVQTSLVYPKNIQNSSSLSKIPRPIPNLFLSQSSLNLSRSPSQSSLIQNQSSTSKSKIPVPMLSRTPSQSSILRSSPKKPRTPSFQIDGSQISLPSSPRKTIMKPPANVIYHDDYDNDPVNISATNPYPPPELSYEPMEDLPASLKIVPISSCSSVNPEQISNIPVRNRIPLKTLGTNLRHTPPKTRTKTGFLLKPPTPVRNVALWCQYCNKGPFAKAWNTRRHIETKHPNISSRVIPGTKKRTAEIVPSIDDHPSGPPNTTNQQPSTQTSSNVTYSKWKKF